jgi:hypothetical protein
MLFHPDGWLSIRMENHPDEFESIRMLFHPDGWLSIRMENHPDEFESIRITSIT